MSSFESIYCKRNAIINDNFEIMGGQVTITPTILYTSAIQSLVTYSVYYPHLKMVVFSMRA